MKTAEYCVDYLSYQWQSTDDLITTYKEICKQRQKYVVNNVTTTASLLQKNQKKLKKSEEYKLKRFQNALWRTMAKNCTSHLGKSNHLINPATVSWQKESDITWLYGPMYYSNPEENSKSSKTVVQPSLLLQGLKPVLKKQSNVTQYIFHQPEQNQHQLPTCSDDSNSLLLFYSSIITTTSEMQQSGLFSGGSSITTSASSSTRSSFSSVSSSSSSTSNNKVGVHFNPEIIEIEYQPEYPVSLESSPLSCFPIYQEDDQEDDLIADYGFYSSQQEMEEAEEQEEDDAIWSLLVGASKSFTYTQISTLFSKCKTLYTQQKASSTKQSTTSPQYIPATRKNHTHNNNRYHSIQLVYLMISMMKLTTTWLLYQSLSPFSLWLSLATTATTTTTTTKPIAVSYKNNTAGQSTTTTSNKQSKKAATQRLIIL